MSRHISALGLGAALVLCALSGCKDDSGGAPCPAGVEGCACAEGVCDDGLFCDGDGVCVVGASSELDVTDAAARACEAVFEDPAGAIEEVRFDDALLGEHLRRGPHVAVSVTQRADAPIEPGTMSVIYAPGIPTLDIAIVSSTCFDDTGREIAGAQLRLAE